MTVNLWPELAANARPFPDEPARTSDRLALIIRQMEEAGIPAGFRMRLASIVVDVRQMEKHASEAIVTELQLADELARPGSNVVLLPTWGGYVA